MPSVSPADPVRSILVATDGSDVASRAIERALTVAERTGASVHVLTVVDTDGAPLRFDIESVHDLEDARERLVEDVVSAFDEHTVDVTGAVLRGTPARAIVTYAEENDVDLIVIGRTGYGGVTETLLGGTADRVVRTASVPVVVVPDLGGGEDE
ncbi:universal stress protein [Natrarchaeobius halalkaliphilus]|uniref:Universal stress protein n=1 Tax=Natrarchaeobius halalkaliphilus TaxID=1679091 RepID=A0A3N6MTH1_9EURY|nr:universal stress protein [Natrarchaeobius halalkaliphilus]RQG88105.1 universal stress protein [Natrarchaeobius halalkaliphilus]